MSDKHIKIGLSIGGKIWLFASFRNIPGYVSFINVDASKKKYDLKESYFYFLIKN
jgi:hypothetical protein